ncbi:hypothetical protein F4860DRAFT_506666 [Xylaria cubensis]|nr:hypothetical protein F4860DRAFT_506666 [Xylaria cubensis]
MSSTRSNLTFDWVGVIATHGTIKVPCGICGLRLSVHHPPKEYQVESFTILPCGHAFGYKCIQALFQIDDSALCPSCEVSARHSGCGHLAKLGKMQQEDKNLTLEMVDKDGLPALCDHCVRKPSKKSSTKN